MSDGSSEVYGDGFGIGVLRGVVGIEGPGIEAAIGDGVIG